LIRWSRCQIHAFDDSGETIEFILIKPNIAVNSRVASQNWQNWLLQVLHCTKIIGGHIQKSHCYFDEFPQNPWDLKPWSTKQGFRTMLSFMITVVVFTTNRDSSTTIVYRTTWSPAPFFLYFIPHNKSALPSR
jgi:hypothetical protein